MRIGFESEFSPLANVYRLSPARLHTLLLLYAFNLLWYGLLLVLFLTLLHREPEWKILFMSLFASWQTFRLLACIRIRLVTSPAGIAYIGPGYRIFTPWENIAGVGEATVLPYGRPGLRRLTGLTLRQPAPRFKRQWWARLVMRSRDSSALFIPLSDFEARDGKLAEALQC